MVNIPLKELLEKYEQGNCSQEEEAILLRYFNDFQEDDAWEEIGVDKKPVIHDQAFHQIERRVDRKIKEERSNRSRVWRVAASIVLAAGIGLGVYFSDLTTVTTEVIMITKTTEPGQKLTVKLPDGSRVYLNSGTRLTYPEVFSDDRRVTLIGEAFFEVTRNPDKKFIIATGDINTTVLGTSFNINAYPDEKEVEVTVASGRVEVSSSDQKFEISRGQQVNYKINEKILTYGDVDIAVYTAWKDGVLQFNGSSLYDIAAELERWYGVEIHFDREQNDQCDLRLSFDDPSLEEVLDQLKVLAGINYQFNKGGHVKIMGTGCIH
ncbi:DUF4974 domain-containing protein [Fulvivirga sp. M361]|uniref:FecR family protein n=1 Tax=Fulvivirga sp. M361 TaxID=2594266 RepID=UPI00117B1AF4|nr:FecR family protein [Fulvivirga sp. M361]TRX60769.1 DUF4974 domain-containing protein [Fulvivirga sp. M361]